MPSTVTPRTTVSFTLNKSPFLRQVQPADADESAQMTTNMRVTANYKTVTLPDKSVVWRIKDDIKITVIAVIHPNTDPNGNYCWVDEDLFPILKDDTAKGITKDDAQTVKDKNAALVKLLAHEQGHMDVATLLARDLLAELRALITPTPTDYGTMQEADDDVTSRRDATLTEIDSLNTAYDDQTTHGTDDAEQTKWTAMFTAAHLKKITVAAAIVASPIVYP